MIKVKISFIVTLAVLAAAYYFYGKEIINSLFLTFISMLAVSMVSLLFLKKYIKVRLGFPDGKFFVDDKLKIYLEVKNKSVFLYPYIHFTSEFIDVDGRFRLLPFSNIKIELNCSLSKRGIYTLQNYFLEASDMFSISSRRLNFDDGFMMKIYPKIIKLPLKVQKIIDDTVNCMENNISMYMPDTYFSVEKYAVGDSLKNVHWKVSAKRNNLYVKKFDVVEKQGIKIYMDMLNYNVSDEMIVSFSISIIRHVLYGGESIYLNIENSNSASFKLTTPEDYELILLYYLKHKSMGEGNFFNRILKNEQKSNPKYKCTYIITYGILPGDIKMILKIKESCKNLIIFTLEDISGDLKKKLSDTGIYWTFSEEEV
ncbi:MAG: DUF58 domain-containing protein [Clostridium sp.]|jgi:hypothetical protein|uniref:DUF58 domain-containing protein n=1 Tax=Clostridium sp. TaxID=1506 RepID=UPI0025BE7649|nr:DUF58 domain-containing protein [Clostridium sp.]MCH3964267.1 DUF58 domain-containing protein [Clostridium sp.]MCI1715447.1 DUF58 domain-containing protein [Clostridium sp.]MCI1799762.1 DUF58 domain-containing protein [Clostridium sp.]MCI1813630.1 DUF58 domain-containing protein [Clostridium sp.]MCI1870579.1 DUF58 domain-containing protein [Clostridium sp.]